MSSVNDLIRELCPDGVDAISLGEAESCGMVTMGRGKVISKQTLEESPGNYPVYSSSAAGTGEFGRYGEFMFEDERITWSIDGGGKFFYRPEHRYSVTNVSGWMTSDSTVLSLKFLYQSLISQWEREEFDYTRKAHPSVIREVYTIPLPPLQVQEEIVRILDQFVELDRELEQEVGGRELQKTALSNALFDQMSAYPLVPLQSIGTWFGGGTPSKKNDSFWKNGVIPWVSPKDMQGHSVTSTVDYITEEAVAGSSAKLVPAGSTALVTRSSILDKRLPVAYFPQTVAMNQDLKAVCPQDGINGRYLFNALEHSRESILLQAHKKGGSVASLDTKRLMLFEVPLPPLEVQEEIANKLDTFTEYIDSLKRERELRQKQYEYYRDLLLDFPVKE